MYFAYNVFVTKSLFSVLPVVDDMESVVLDEATQKTSQQPPTEVMQAWTKDTPISL